jgi:hypothetical protein
MYCASLELIEFEPKEQKTDLAQALVYQGTQKKESNCICYF